VGNPKKKKSRITAKKLPVYLYKVMVEQDPQQVFKNIEATSIEEAEQHGTVVLLLGATGEKR